MTLRSPVKLKDVLLFLFSMLECGRCLVKNSTLCVETYFIRNYFQAGTLIDNELNVKPGTPLNMEVLNKSTILQSCQNLVYLDSIAYNLKGSSVYV